MGHLGQAVAEFGLAWAPVSRGVSSPSQKPICQAGSNRCSGPGRSQMLTTCMLDIAMDKQKGVGTRLQAWGTAEPGPVLVCVKDRYDKAYMDLSQFTPQNPAWQWHAPPTECATPVQ